MKDLEAFIIPTTNGLEKVVRYNDIEKELKALKIIKKHIIDPQDIIIFNTYSAFNQRRSLRGLLGITKEEYDLLIEVLL